ncbi:MAG: hypothetical protein HYT70_02790 [Candidatus Aenigmarchaeota archaeon]|nr:hypothetical protein [Candidatus Aenigmarchaeota archaeon]
MRPSLSLILNILLRLLIVYFLVEVMLFPEDPRFAGKAIPLRNLIIVGGLSLLFPLLYFLGKKRKSYPYLADFIYLSIYIFDMAGNSLNLYDTVWYYDIIAHFYGTGAFAAVAYLVILGRQKFGAIKLSGFEILLFAVGIATIIHVGLELQEYYTDVFFGTHNVVGKTNDVQGMADTGHDLVAGFLGSFVYIWAVNLLFALNSRYKNETLESLGTIFTRG